jgi:hypothetical protein
LASRRLQGSVGSALDEAVAVFRFVAIVILVTGPLKAKVPAVAPMIGMYDLLRTTTWVAKGILHVEHVRDV